MTDYSELVKALRLCQFGECGCGKCYYKELKGDWCTEDNHPEFFDCDDKLKLDAAAAIEALQAQLPKRGEWVEDTTTYAGPGLSNYKCSLCGKICGTWRRGLEPSELPNWCGNCGADMWKMEVQE